MIDNFYIEPPKKEWQQILQRPIFDTHQLEQIVLSILNNVRNSGDQAVRKYTSQFDNILLKNFKVSEKEFVEAIAEVNINLKQAINIAKENITKFHQFQKEEIKIIETTNGVECWRKSIAIDKVGLYIPGGTAPLFSTLLMLGIPATIAGCNNIVVCTPPNIDGKVNPVILYVANLLGLKNVYKIGGVQAIAAMAYGTKTIPKVYKIFGPGNQYVTCAKQLINKGGIAIDMPAGPSEVAVFADETCNPIFVAADLLSQAEHGVDSQVLLVTTSEFVGLSVLKELETQLCKLPRKKIVTQVLNNSKVVVLQNITKAFEMLNEYAPEHLIIASNNAEALAEKVINAGSVFLGHYSPESVGDYASGTNHTLPTNGYAKAYSGVSVDSFVKKVTFQQLTREGLNNISNAVELMAEAEGLKAHSSAVRVRKQRQIITKNS